MNKRNKKHLPRIAAVVFAALLVIYLGYQAYMYFYTPYKSATAVMFKVSDEIQCEGVVVRDEIVLDEELSGYFVFSIENGDKIAKNATVADVYNSLSVLESLARLDVYVAERAALIAVNNYANNAAGYDASVNAVYSSLAGISLAAGSISTEDLATAETELLDSLGAYRATIGDAPYCSERITQLNSLISELERGITSPDHVVSAPETGYFMTYTDGYETLLNKSDVLDMSVAEIAELAELNPSKQHGMKLVSGYEWYYCAIVDSKYSGRFSVGNTLTLDFNYAGVASIPASVVALKTDVNEGKTLVVFKCSYFNSATASLRCESALIRFRTYSGVRIDRSALRLHEGKTGVYIKYGNYIRFRQIDIIYETEDYVISSVSTESGYLMLYDEIITAGKDLYVGKEIS